METITDLVSLDAVEPSVPVRVAGTVRRLRLDPLRGTIEATIEDSAVSATARWSLRRPIRQMRAVPGSTLILEGTAGLDEGGELLFIDPDYLLVPSEGNGGEHDPVEPLFWDERW